jgi:hypothetical protein
MPKITLKKKSTTTSNPISSRTREAATNLLTINTDSSRRTNNTIAKHTIPVKKNTDSSRRTNNTIAKHTIPVKKNTDSSRRTNNTIAKHTIPVKKNTPLSFPGTPHFYRVLNISDSWCMTIATYLEKLEKDRKDKKPIQVRDKFSILDPSNPYNEIKVMSISSDKKTCTVLRKNTTRRCSFLHSNKSSIYKKWVEDLNKGKMSSFPTDTLRNQLLYRRKHDMVKMNLGGFCSDALVLKAVKK